MTFGTLFARIAAHPGLNFLATNCIPRRTATRLVGWLSRIEHPVVRDFSIAAFRICCAPDLSEARKAQFTSLRDCFIRELADGRRNVDADADMLVSPCDGIVGATGVVERGMMLQVKGSSYPLAELVGSEDVAAFYEGGCYVTLRLTAGMYHRFHAPYDCRVCEVGHIWGDAWNVNPPTLARIPRVYCRNERAVVHLELGRGSHRLLLVPVAAVLVAGIKLHGFELPPERDHEGLWSRECAMELSKGQEMGWFEHGSTIVVVAPPGFAICPEIEAGHTIEYGKALMRLPRS